MRVAIIAGPNVPVPPAKYGGTEQVIYYLIKGLTEAGHEPILVGPGDSTVDCEIIPIVERALYFPRYKSDLKIHLALEAQAEAETRKRLSEILPKIDIIHSHGFDLTPFKNFPNLTTIHYMIDFRHYEILNKRKSLYFASISQNQQAAYPQLKYIDNIYNGEDPSKFLFVAEPEDYVCFLGRFDRDKNPHLAIELAINMGIKIKFGGKIDYRAEGYFEEEVGRYFNHPLVEYLGELDFNQKIELLSKAKCNLHPTNFREPFGLTVLEAAYCGAPTLATARGSMPELIEPGRTGMLVEDFIEGRQHIEDCFAMDRHYISTRSRELFNYKNMANQYVSAYSRIIELMPSHISWRRPIKKIRSIFSDTKQSLKEYDNKPDSFKKTTG